MKQFCLGIITAIGLTLPAFGQQVFNPPDGSYQLNLAKSTIHGPFAVTSQTLNVTRNTFSATGLDASGRPYTWVFQFIMDGKSRPVTGSPAYDADAYTQLNPYTVGVTRTKDGKTVQTGISIYNPETKTITFAAVGGSAADYVLVYEGQVDPLIGTWKLNLQKSTSTLPMFKSATLAITGEGQNRTLTAEGVDANSQLFKVVYRHIYDEQPHPTTGSPDYDSSTYTRIGNTINIVRFRQGKAVEVGQGVIVPGQTYTVSVEGMDVNNQVYRSATVFDRQ